MLREKIHFIFCLFCQFTSALADGRHVRYSFFGQVEDCLFYLLLFLKLSLHHALSAWEK